MRSTALLALISVPVVLASSHGHDARRHHEVAKRAGAEVNLYKRFDGVRLTFYAAGLGACGKTNSASDFIVALNREQYGNGQYCFKPITITVGGKSAQATIVDECEGCPFGGLDLSQGLFDHLGSESAGVLTGSWEFGSGGGDSSSSSSSSSSTHHTTSSSTSSSSSTHKTSSSSSSSSSSTPRTTSTAKAAITSTSTTPTSTAINYSTGDASGLAAPTGSIGSGVTNNIDDFNQAIVNIGGLIVAGRNQN